MSPSRFLLAVAILLALSAGLLALQTMWGGDGAEAVLHVAPLQAPLARASASWNDWLVDLKEFRQLADRNRALEAENIRLRLDNERLASLQLENQRLGALLKLRKEHHPQALTARVAARDPNLWNLQIVLDRGSLDGVHRDMVVVAPQGLVGRVFQVGPKACRVRLLLDPRSAVPALLADSGAVGIVYGHDAQTCTMKFIAHDVPIREGELVMTSGLGEVYPRGIPLGRVIRRLGRTESLFQSVQVRSEVEFRALSEALLLSRNRGD